MTIKLGVNIDHVATLREARKEKEPDPLLAAEICEQAGADSIIAHLREDRRHINDTDVKRLRKTVKTRFNLEMSIDQKIIDIALKIKPDQATLVPERRREITTEGGLDVVRQFNRVSQVVEILQKWNIKVNLFIDPAKEQIDQVKKMHVHCIELHTGSYSKAQSHLKIKKELDKLQRMTRYARNLGLVVNAGHGLNYENVTAISKIPGMEELNIGHSIVSRAVWIGLENAVREMINLIKKS